MQDASELAALILFTHEASLSYLVISKESPRNFFKIPSLYVCFLRQIAKFGNSYLWALDAVELAVQRHFVSTLTWWFKTKDEGNVLLVSICVRLKDYTVLQHRKSHSEHIAMKTRTFFLQCCIFNASSFINFLHICYIYYYYYYYCYY